MRVRGGAHDAFRDQLGTGYYRLYKDAADGRCRVRRMGGVHGLGNGRP